MGYRPRPLLALALLLPLASAQETPVVAELLRISAEDSRVEQPLQHLVEVIGPRLSGSTNLQRACEWARDSFAAIGLDARLDRWGEMPVGFDRGVSQGGMVAPREQPFVFGTPAWSAGTDGPLRGRAVLAPYTVEALEEEAELWSGAWVVDWPRAVRPRLSVRRQIRAALRGMNIAGRVHDAGELVRTFGNYAVDPAALPTAINVGVQRTYFRELVELLGQGVEVELEFDIDNRFVPGPVPQFNVIADLVGSEFPGEFVVVGGHLDSWDGSPCAQDNGTGCATTLEAARLLVAAGAQPRRTIRFVLWTGEEQGMLGSKAYVAAHPEEMKRISAVLNHDGGTNCISGIDGPPALVADLRAAFAPVMRLDSPMPFTVEENEGLRWRGSSDHVSYLRAGVPAFSWRQAGTADYNLVHHSRHDTLEHVVSEYQCHSALIVAIGAYNLANLDTLLSREGLIDPRTKDNARDPRHRYMGVYFDGPEVASLVDGGMARSAGWLAGDIVLSVDGVKVSEVEEIVAELQKGGPRKIFRLQRGPEVIESVLDYSEGSRE